jgi:hypothetical protein
MVLLSKLLNLHPCNLNVYFSTSKKKNILGDLKQNVLCYIYVEF